MMYYQEERSSARMFVGMAVVIVVHVAIFYALKDGLTNNFMPMLPKSFQTVFIKMSEPKPAEPAPAEPQLQTLPIEEIVMPMPDIKIPMDSVMEMPAAAQAPARPQQESGAGESTAITQLQVDSRYPLTKPDYPSISRRMGERGTVKLLLYVLPNGRVGEARIAHSSGYPRLDESALREARRNWRFIPGTYGGEAVSGWGTFAITFQLTD